MASIDKETNSKFPNDKIRFITNLMFTAGWIQNEFTKHLKPFDISPQQYNILRILRGAKDWLTMFDVKDRMIEKSPNATRLADKLLLKKLVERQRSDNDRRVVYLKVTKKGLKLIEEIDKIENKIENAMSKKLTNKNAKIASDILDNFRG
jgi:DNA-binding MarR family transcriptional regulator